MNMNKEKAIILAIETSSRKGSVAIARNEKMLAEKLFSSPLKHSSEIFPSIRDLLDRFNLNPNQIEHIYISGGPGSFTGLRIAATIAKMMQLAYSTKIVSVDTLDVIAANVIDLSAGNISPASNHKLPVLSGERIATVLDAKRGQFFIAVYERKTVDQRNSAGKATWKKILPDSLMTPSQFLERFAHKDKPIRLLGDGLLYYKDTFKADGVFFYNEKYWSPRAGNVLQLGRQMALKGQFTDALTLTPNYLRKPEVTIKTR
jgi:tRNA threonylcarbamoyladenosine biosynthesis protein TsaB